MVQFTNLDLNLLRVFLALMVEGNATRAGERLGLSPSAVSHALSRLRDRLGDPLFVRGSHSLQPTPRAEAMAPGIRRAMADLERAITLPAFDPTTAVREFSVVANSYTCSVLLPRFAAAFEAAAPNCRLRVRAPEPGLAELLHRGLIDVVICTYDTMPARFTNVPLFEETAAWVIRADHPAAKRGLTVGALAKLPRIDVSSLDPWNTADASLDSPGSRRVPGWDRAYMKGLEPIKPPQLCVPDIHSALAMVMATDMTALLPRRLILAGLEAGTLVEAKLKVRPPPVRVGAISLKAGKDSPVSWLINLMAASLID